METSQATRFQFIGDYLTALEGNATGEALARFYTDDAEQIEFPNQLHPRGGRSDLTRLLERAKSVPSILQRQHYEVHSMLAEGDLVAVEATWTGVLAVPFQPLPAGSTMTAHFAIFFELRAGRIHRQRNYDCFEPWQE